MILTKFFVCISSEAIETRHALHGIRWPTSNPKCLNVDFGTESLMEKAIASTNDDIKPSVTSRDDRIVSSNELHDKARERVINFDSMDFLFCEIRKLLLITLSNLVDFIDDTHRDRQLIDLFVNGI